MNRFYRQQKEIGIVTAKCIKWITRFHRQNWLLLNSIIKSTKKANIRNRYNQVPHLIWESDNKHHIQESHENIKYRIAKRSALSQQVTTRLQDTDKTIWQRQTQIKKSHKRSIASERSV